MLQKLPQEFHKLIEPDLRQWDQNFQTKTQEVQSKFAPYNEFVENEIPPDQINAALQIMAMIDADPQGFYNQMGEFYKEQWGQGQTQSNLDDTFSLGDTEQDFDITQHPKFQEVVGKLEGNQQIIAQVLQQQMEAEQSAKADAELDSEISTLTEKYGEWDPRFVFPLVMSGQAPDLESAVKMYLEAFGQSKPSASSGAPPVFAPSGGIPSSQPDPAKLSDKETRSLVSEILARANSEG